MTDLQPHPVHSPTLTFCAGGCNHGPGALSTLPAYSLAAHASACNVLILTYGEGAPRVSAALPVRKGHVRCVKLVEHLDAPFVIAATSDARLVIWSRCSTSSTPRWVLCADWMLHDGPCVALDAVVLGDDLHVVSADTNATICYSVLSDPASPAPLHLYCSTGTTPDGRLVLPECVALRVLNDLCTLIAVGGTDNRICLYESDRMSNSGQISRIAVLEGHRGWVRSLAFSTVIPEDAPDEQAPSFLLASASDDSTARIWKLERKGRQDAPFATGVSTVPMALCGTDWAATPIALLDEHTAAVHTVAFSSRPLPGADAAPMNLLTSSKDCTIALWTPSGSAWSCAARFGLMGSAAAHALGFYGASFLTHDANAVIAHNHGGAMHIWRLEPAEGAYNYVAHYAPGGHFGVVTDLCWEPHGRYMLTVGADKTARIFAEVQDDADSRFVEWARPQVHGHPLITASFCDEDGRQYVSGAEEKMPRVFKAPTTFNLPGEDAMEDDNGTDAAGACVPELGLSNKAVFTAVAVKKGDDQGQMVADSSESSTQTGLKSFMTSRATSIAPLEDVLRESRLWPETAKLYGHGDNMSSLAVDINNGIMASACISKGKKNAFIILWDLKTGEERGRLGIHESTVLQMRFSGNGKYLASVSRDRSFAVYLKDKAVDRFTFRCIMHVRPAHERQVFACSWVLKDRCLATGGRDKTLKIFQVSDRKGDSERLPEILFEKFTTHVSALDSASFQDSNIRTVDVLAVGFDSGDIRLFIVEADLNGNIVQAPAMKEILHLEPEMGCGARISRLQWRPTSHPSGNQPNQLQLGVASEDFSVRVYSFQLNRTQPAMAIVKD